ncbi:beta strand repeat-containing protein [Polynucleobacter campilacus]|uniref:Flagellin N-terminal domain-containing protein n=1 Tax=Polynucleobacter campilacus TaxID=1743163 RepID=A0A254Q2D8_9BURK|nr:hypothetical protein [Polynucleobacter campilacus]OWS69107.1 hypothetical protein CBI31_08525 [Polynucleobacter campilacus]
MNNSITTLASSLQSAVNDVQARLEATHTQIADGKQPLSKQQASVVARLSNQATSQDAVQGNITNANNIIDITQTGLSSISSILAQMQSLATQVSNGLFNSVDQTNLFTQFASLNRQIGQIAATTSLNGNNLLTGNQTLSVVSGTDGVNNQTTLIQGIDITRLQTALNAITFAVASQNLTPTTVVDGVPTVSNPTSAQQTISFNGLAYGDSATIGGLTFTANRDLTAAQVATVFAQKVNTPGGTSAYGTFTNSFTGSFTASDNGSGTVIFTGSITGPQSISVSGNIASITTRISSSNITGNTPGVTDVAPTSARQTISFNGLANGDSATISGLTFTANKDLSATQVAAIFADKVNNPSGTPPMDGSFTGSFSGSFTGVHDGSGTIVFSGSSTGPQSILVGGSIASGTTRINVSNITSNTPGVTDVPSSLAQQTIRLNSMASGDTVNVGGLIFTANSNLTAAEVATIVASKINSNSYSPSFALGAFDVSSSFLGGFDAPVITNGTITLRGQAAGPRGQVPVSSSVSARSPLGTSNETVISSGEFSTANITVSFLPLAAGNTATVGGLSFTANTNLTPAEIATVFAEQFSSPGSLPSIGSFTGSFQGGFNISNNGSGILTFQGDSAGIRTLGISGRTANATIQLSDVSVSDWGSGSSSGSNAIQRITLHDISAGQTATIGGLTFTANTNVSAADLASRFWLKMNNTDTGTGGSFNGTNFTAPFNSPYNSSALNSGLLYVTANSTGPQSLISVSGSTLTSSDVTTTSDGIAGGPGSPSRQKIQFHDMFPGESVRVDNLTFIANTFLNATTVATNFSERMSSNSSSPTGGYFSGTYGASFVPGSISNGALSITGSYNGYQGSIYVTGSTGSITSTSAYLSSSNVTTQAAGSNGTPGVLALQTISLNALNKGDTAIISGLTLTANEDLTPDQVASFFADKITSNANNPSSSLGSFNGTTFTGGAFNASSLGRVLTLTGQNFGPMGTVSVDGSVTARVALSSSNVTTQAAGSNGVLGVRAVQTVTLYDLNAGDSATIGGLTLTANTNLTPSEVASLFASKITAGREPGSNLGAFSGTFVGGFTGVSTGSTLTLTGTSYGPMATVTASQMVSGQDNAPKAIALINQFISQISSTQASLSAASTDLNSALDKSTKLVTSSQKTVDDIQNIDLTALQASLQALSTQQSLDFQVISQMNNAASSLLAIFR